MVALKTRFSSIKGFMNIYTFEIIPLNRSKVYWFSASGYIHICIVLSIVNRSTHGLEVRQNSLFYVLVQFLHFHGH